MDDTQNEDWHHVSGIGETAGTDLVVVPETDRFFTLKRQTVIQLGVSILNHFLWTRYSNKKLFEKNNLIAPIFFLSSC